MYAAPAISGGALLGPTNATGHTGTLSSQLTMNRNRATGSMTLYPPPLHTDVCTHTHAHTHLVLPSPPLRGRLN